MADPIAPQRMQIADDLFIDFVRVATLREQDINAQVMQPRHMDQLIANVKQRGQLESLPYCHQPNGEGVVSVVSGHHRVRAANAAGMEVIPVIIDTREMSDSEIAAKQIAHNEIHGSPDEEALARLIAVIDNVNDLLATGLDESMLPVVGNDAVSPLLPAAELDYRQVLISFLPDQVAQFQASLDRLAAAEVHVSARRDQFEEFSDLVLQYGRAHNIKSVSTQIAYLVEIARHRLELVALRQAQPGEMVDLAEVLNLRHVPTETAAKVGALLADLIADGTVKESEPWGILDALVNKYLG